MSFSRQIRVLLTEKKIDFAQHVERYWENRAEFLALNPASEVPVLVEEDGTVLADATAIAEYIEELHPEPPLIGSTPEARAEVRRLIGWFNAKFNREVTVCLVGEKVIKRLGPQPSSQPDSRSIRSGFAAIHNHLEYISWLTERRTWLAGSSYSMADIAAAAHLSCVDYLGDVPWATHGGAKDWYARVKSRPAFRALLADHLPGMPPPKHYADLDF